jgi:Zn-dependent alcohol dehydrogenase
MEKMKSVQGPSQRGNFEIVEREIPEPGPGRVKIGVLACGVCHSAELRLRAVTRSNIATQRRRFPHRKRSKGREA